jgi:hypothetical protein
MRCASPDYRISAGNVMRFYWRRRYPAGNFAKRYGTPRVCMMNVDGKRQTLILTN